jgi:RNA polymerase sigma-70 factor (ECF subfamily)
MAGEREKLLLAFTEQRDALLRFLARRLGNTATAEDLAQETWLRAARVDGSIAIDNPRSYLFRIAANLVLDHQRHKAQGVEVQAPETVVAAVADATPSPELVALHRSEIKRLMHVVDQLSPRCREVFVLVKFEGLSHNEVARRLGIARTTVVTHMVTALAALEREMPRKKSAGPSPGFASRPS